MPKAAFRSDVRILSGAFRIAPPTTGRLEVDVFVGRRHVQALFIPIQV